MKSALVFTLGCRGQHCAYKRVKKKKKKKSGASGCDQKGEGSDFEWVFSPRLFDFLAFKLSGKFPLLQIYLTI